MEHCVLLERCINLLYVYIKLFVPLLLLLLVFTVELCIDNFNLINKIYVTLLTFI